MAFPSRLVLLLLALLAVSTRLSHGQHWSHGWYPGGKRELDVPAAPEISEEIKLCEGEECAYLRNSRKNLLKNILADVLARQLQKK
ncbi:progonadoliberin-2 [Anomaloglossus baeobatrachus]|uniref:progonadoliberin-2 n=1 Tax=Anomaloglossus baeobatrachus TaxID=238106 RepID=UPI003F50515E